MNDKRSFRPRLEQVEDRVVMSFSLGNFVNSIFPGLDKPHVVKHVGAPRVHPAHTAAHRHPLPHHHGIHALRHAVKP